MLNQLNIIRNINWDHLIVLDACRYDYFTELWNLKEYPVYRAFSPASWTLEWLSIVFNKRFPDVTVYSSNPYINNMKKPICLHGVCWSAYGKFAKIIEVWRLAWSKKWMTVPPWSLYNIVKMSLKLNKKRYGKRRTVIWFLQPHYPYISNNFLEIMSFQHRLTKEDFLKGNLDIIMRAILNKIIRKNLNLLREMYSENLQKALNYVYKLIDDLEGTIIITADHGEHLGEFLVKAILSSVKNSFYEAFYNKEIRSNLFRRIAQLPNYIKIYNLNSKLSNTNYIHGMRIFFHPPLLSSNELRSVPLVIIRK